MGRSFPGGAATDRIIPTGFNSHATLRTYSAWFILDDSNSLRRIIDKETGATTLVSLWWHAAENRFYFQHRFTGGLGEWMFPVSTAEADGNWHHIAVIYDSSSPTNDPTFYLDGSPVAVADGGAHAPSGSSQTAATDWMIGNRSDFTRGWDGDLAEIAVWDRILSGVEVANLAAGVSPLTMDTGLALYLPLEGTTTPEPDLGPGGFDATVVGTSQSASHPPVDEPPPSEPPTRVISFQGRSILIDGVPLNPGSLAEGVPTNIRLVNATVDFSEEITWDADANTNALIAQLPNYASYGLNAITINFQGGLPQPITGITWATDGGYDAGAFNPNGSLRSAHTARISNLIDAMLANNIIPIVGLFYFRQDDIFTNEQAIRDAVDNAAAFLAPWRDQILVEIANEASSGNWDHTILTDTDVTGVEQLISQMQGHGFRVSTSFSGTVHPPPASIVGGADFILLHGNDRTTAQMISDIDAAIAAYPSKPILYNEDGPTNRAYGPGELLEHYAEAIEEGVGWGIYLQDEYQTATSPTIDWSVRAGDSEDFFDQTSVYTVGQSDAIRTITDTLTITDSGSLVAGEPGPGELVSTTDTVTWRLTRPTESAPTSEQVATKADWAVYAVHRQPASSGFPTFAEVGEVPFTALSWTRRLNQSDQIALSVPLNSLNATVRAGLKKPWEMPLELWVFRLSQPMAAGPIWPGTLQGNTLSINAGGVLDYLRGMIGTSSDLSYFEVDQAAIVKALVDHYQAKPFGHFGIATDAVILTGLARTRSYLAAEPSDVFSLVQNLTQVQNGPDVDIELTLDGTQVERSLAVYYPQKGRDLASAVVLDTNVISSSDVVFGVGPGDIASVATVYGGGNNLPPVRAESTNADLLGTWGRWGAAETAPNVVNAETVDDHAAELLAARSGRLYLPGPYLRSTAEVNPASVGTGDAVTYDYDDGLGRDTLVGRLVEITTTVDSAGERMRVQLS